MQQANDADLIVNALTACDAGGTPIPESRAAARALLRRIQAHRARTGRVPGPGCDCADCAGADWCGSVVAPQCATCGDARRVRRPIPFGQPGFGQSVPCPACRGEAVELAERVAHYRAALAPQIPVTAWEDLRLERLEPADATPRPEVTAWVRQAHQRRPWLVLCSGGLGSGKTHAATGAAIAWVEAGKRAHFTKVTDMLLGMRSTIAQHGDLAPVVERYRSPALVVFDDLGTQQVTDWSEEILYAVLDHRYAHALPTIITTNVVPTAADMSSRLWSRVFSQRSAVVWIRTFDHRIQRRTDTGD